MVIGGGSRGAGGGVVSEKNFYGLHSEGRGGEGVSAPDSTTYSFKKVAMVSIARLSCMATPSLRYILTFCYTKQEK